MPGYELDRLIAAHPGRFQMTLGFRDYSPSRLGIRCVDVDARVRGRRRGDAQGKVRCPDCRALP